MQALGLALERHQHASKYGSCDGVRVEHSDLFGDDAARSVAREATLHGTGREADQVAQLIERARGVGLQQVEELAVELVELESVFAWHATLLRRHA
jgi:hypothetical protein